MQKEALKYVLTENTARKFPATVPRALELPLNTTRLRPLLAFDVAAELISSTTPCAGSKLAAWIVGR